MNELHLTAIFAVLLAALLVALVAALAGVVLPWPVYTLFPTLGHALARRWSSRAEQHNDDELDAREGGSR